MTKFVRLSPVALAFGYVAFGIAALVLFAAPLWYAWRVTIEDGRAEILKEDAQRLTEVFRREGPKGLIAFVNERVGLQIAGERILLFTDSSLRPLAGNLKTWPLHLPDKAGVYTTSVDLDGHQTRAAVVRAALPGGYNLLVGRDTARYEPLQVRFWYGLAGAMVILTIVGIIGGVLIQHALLSRIHGIRQTVSAIMQGNLSHRLATRPSGDELDTFSQTINGMLGQIEQLINGIRNVSNSIAHDLRTPLAELRSRLEELSLTKPPLYETFAEIDAAVADVDRVIGIFNALLRLAEIDTGMRRSGFVAVDVASVAAEVVEFYSPAAEVEGVALSFSDCSPVPERVLPPAPESATPPPTDSAPTSRTEIIVAGDPVLLAQAIGNLIDNALKYAPTHGRIDLKVAARTDGGVEIVVADNGPGIPDEEKPKVVERFYRGDASRGTPGVGLGLSLVDAVAKLHGGTLEFQDNHPGLRAVMSIERVARS